jgi:hypothetical protein
VAGSPRKVVLDGRGTITLRDSDYVAAGGEGTVYRANATIVKIYADGAKMIRDGMTDKIKLLADRLKYNDIIAPQGVVLDESGKPIGFYMPFVDGEPLSRVFVSDFRARTRFGDRDAATLADRMREVVQMAHAAKAVMVDANELNWLVQYRMKSGAVPKVIDVDSWAIGRWPATVVMPSIRDWNAAKFDANSDWFGWGVLAFQVFTGIHPYKGKIDGYRPGDLIQRMKDNASVFDARARMPHSVRDFSCIPGPLLDWFQATFQQGERTVPPSPLDRAAPAKAARIMRAVTTATGSLIFERMFGRANDPVIRVWPNGAALLRSGIVVDLATGSDLMSGASADCEVVRLSGTGWVIADQNGGLPRFTHVDGNHRTPLAFLMSTRRLFRAGERLFATTDRELLELQIRMLGKPTITVSRRWTMLMNSTSWFDGVAVQDVMGATFVFLPIDHAGSAQVRVKELDGLKVISAMAGGHFAAFVAVDRAGGYQKIELTFDKNFGSYSAWTGGTDSPDLNMAILPTGVVGTIAADGELTLFVPANGNVNKVQDRHVTTAMELAGWRDRLVYIFEGNVWRVRMST